MLIKKLDVRQEQHCNASDNHKPGDVYHPDFPMVALDILMSQLETHYSQPSLLLLSIVTSITAEAGEQE